MDERGRLAAGAFLLGLGCGLVMAGSAVWNSMKALQERGLQVEVETAMVASQVRTEVVQAVRREVPTTLNAMKEAIPERIAAETAQRLEATTIEIGGFRVAVPAAAVEQVRTEVEEALRAGMEMAVSQVDMDRLADRLGSQAYTLVESRLEELIDGQRFEVRLVPWFSVPVILVAR